MIPILPSLFPPIIRKELPRILSFQPLQQLQHRPNTILLLHNRPLTSHYKQLASPPTIKIEKGSLILAVLTHYTPTC